MVGKSDTKLNKPQTYLMVQNRGQILEPITQLFQLFNKCRQFLMKGIAAISAGAGMHQQQISIQPIGLLRFVYNRLENLFAAPVILVGIEGVVCGTQGAGCMANEL